MLQLEVLDVDPLRAEGLRDPCENAGTVGYVHAEPLQHARLLVRIRKHAAPVVGRLADPAREEPGVALRERTLDLLDPPAMLGERGRESLGIVEKDVDPDPWIRPGDARHVAERATGR